MPVTPKDLRWKTSAELSPTGEIKSKEVLHMNEDLNIIASHMKRLDSDMAKIGGKLREEYGHVPPMVKLAAASRLVATAYDAVEEASRALNEAAQYFET